MEEVKNQIGEQMPGALELFKKAASEFTGKELTTPEFFKMMEKGELLAQDILPLMGKRMSEAAKKGGALEKMLNSNGVAMRRLQQTWTNFQNEIFIGGFGEALSRTFNTLSFALKNNEQMAKSLGGVFGGLVDGFVYFYATVHDYSILAWDAIDKEFLTPLKEAIPLLNEIGGKDAAWLVGWIAAAAMFKGIAGTLAKIVGSLISMKKLLPAIMGGTATATGGGSVAAGAAGGGVAGLLKGGLRGGIYGALMYPVVDSVMEWMIGDTEFGKKAKSITSMDQWGAALAPSLRTDMRPSLQGLIPTNNMMETYPYSPMMKGMPYIPNSVNKPTETMDLRVKVIPDGTKFSEIIRLEIEDSNNKVLNQLSD